MAREVPDTRSFSSLIPEGAFRHEVLRGLDTITFELEGITSEALIETVTAYLSHALPGIQNFTFESGKWQSQGRVVPEHLKLENRARPDSFLVFNDQATAFQTNSRSDGGFTLRDEGFPYMKPHVQGGLAVDRLRTERNGVLQVEYDENKARVNITGSNPGIVITSAAGFLSGLKVGQGIPSSEPTS